MKFSVPRTRNSVGNELLTEQSAIKFQSIGGLPQKFVQHMSPQLTSFGHCGVIEFLDCSHAESFHHGD